MPDLLTKYVDVLQEISCICLIDDKAERESNLQMKVGRILFHLLPRMYVVSLQFALNWWRSSCYLEPCHVPPLVLV